MSLGPELQLPPDPYPWRTDFHGVVLPEVRRLLGGDSKEPRKQRHWTTGDQLLGREFPKADWLIKALISRDSLTIIGADPKASKTWTLLDLALAVSAGGQALGEFPSMVSPSPVALFLNEDGERSVRNRLRALCAGYGYEPERVHNVKVQARLPLDLGDLEQVAAFIADVRALEPRPVLVGIDPLRNVHGAEESSSTEMRPVLRALGVIRQLTGAALVVVHHSAKASKDDPRTGGARLRGSSAIDGYRDGLISLEATEKNEEGNEISNRVVVDLKAYKGAGRFGLRLNIEDDENGEAIKATWAKVEDAAAGAKRDDIETIKSKVSEFILGRLRDEARRARAFNEPPQPLSNTPLYKEAAAHAGCRITTAKEVCEALIRSGTIILEQTSDKRFGLALRASPKEFPRGEK